MLPINHTWQEGSMTNLIEASPKMDLAIHDSERLVKEFSRYVFHLPKA
jgi:hypothetical protein